METIEKLDKYLYAVFPRSIRPFGGLHRALWRPRAACSRSGSAPTPTEATRPFAFTASASSSTLTGQGATTLKLDFTLSLGRLSNCQATEDDCRWSQTVPRVSPLKRTVVSTPPSTSSLQTTSVNASTTNGLPPLRFLTYMCVAVMTAKTTNASDDDTPKCPQMTQVWLTSTASRRDGDRGERRGLNA